MAIVNAIIEEALLDAAKSVVKRAAEWEQRANLTTQWSMLESVKLLSGILDIIDGKRNLPEEG